MSVRVAPDIELIVADYLRAHTDVTALVGSRVSTDEPASPVYPLLLVEMSDGAYRDGRAHWTFEATIDVECKAATKVAASLLARTALAALMECVGYAHAQGHVVDVAEFTGPDWSPDTVRTPPQPRYEFSVLISAHN